jgi:transposase
MKGKKGVELLKYSVGIDVGCKELYVCISSIDSEQKVVIKGSTKFANSVSGFKSLVSWAAKHRKQEEVNLVYVMEATGVYYEELAHFLHSNGAFVSVVVPSKAKNYLKSLGNGSKNDKIDAAGLSRMGAERVLDLWKPYSEGTYELRSLTRHHESLQESRTRFMNQLHAVKHSHYQDNTVIQNLKSHIELFDKQLNELEKAIAQKVKLDTNLNNKWQKISPVFGIGMLSFATIAAETNGFELFDNYKQLVSYAGYDVIENQSGNHQGKTKISKKGNAHLRRILYMPALVAVKKEGSIFEKLYNRIFDRTKIKMKGYVAVQKKLLIIIFFLWKKDVKYDENFLENSLKETFNNEEREALPLAT